MIQNKLRTALWYLGRPRLYPQLLHRAKRFLRRSCLPDTQEEAVLWCEERATSPADAIATVTGSLATVSVRDRFHQVFAAAEERACACPVKMGGAAELDLLYWIAEYLEAKRVVETGVAYGWSSLALLLSLQGRGGSLLSTDMPSPNRVDEYVGCVVPAELRSHWRIVHLADRQAVPKALRELETIDMCHYDSDKGYDGRMWTYPRLWAALRTGGCFISDDIGDNLGFRDFCIQVKVDPIIVAAGDKFVGILIKRRHD